MKQSSSQRTPAPTYLLSVLFFSLAFFTSSLEAFTNPALPKTIVSAKQQTTSTSYARKKYSPLYLSTPSPSSAGSSSSSSSIPVPPPDDVQFERFDGVTPSDEWELDCYSRPVVVNGKKLWEVLLTDSTGSFRFIKTLPSNQVNSKNVRATVESMMEEYVDKYGLETPGVIRFFRGAMFNMINIALMDLEVVAKPSRCTFALAQWLEERNRDVYPKMESYKATMVGGTGPSFLDVRTPVKLPDALRGEQYAFVALPLAEFLPGGDINSENIGVGKLCPIDPSLPGDAFVQGVVIITARPNALASWLAGTEVVGLKADLRKRQLIMETDIDTQYLVARLNDQQRVEGAAFEEGKDALNGFHFISVQKDDESDPAGFWLLREIPTGI